MVPGLNVSSLLVTLIKGREIVLSGFTSTRKGWLLWLNLDCGWTTRVVSGSCLTVTGTKRVSYGGNFIGWVGSDKSGGSGFTCSTLFLCLGM